ncbi:putative transcription factor interactor and regulator AUX-IAA family [Helianthus annuus]|nr:putative transcription factor interactor and regulator AUX-IAA family [Helianthus annuus]
MSPDHKAIDGNDLISTGESDLTVASGLRFDEMELTLGLPGGSGERKSGTKRKFLDMVDLELAVTSSNYRERRVIGWPPVRKNTMNTKNNKYVKVAVDGAPYLRKVDLTSYTGYRQLLSVLEDIMSSFNTQNVFNEKKLKDSVTSRWEHVPTYEDKDGDWMLLGDVPWKMFVETCKRIRLTRGSEAIINQLGVHNVCSSTPFK